MCIFLWHIAGILIHRKISIYPCTLHLFLQDYRNVVKIVSGMQISKSFPCICIVKKLKKKQQMNTNNLIH